MKKLLLVFLACFMFVTCAGALDQTWASAFISYDFTSDEDIDGNWQEATNTYATIEYEFRTIFEDYHTVLERKNALTFAFDVPGVNGLRFLGLASTVDTFDNGTAVSEFRPGLGLSYDNYGFLLQATGESVIIKSTDDEFRFKGTAQYMLQTIHGNPFARYECVANDMIYSADLDDHRFTAGWGFDNKKQGVYIYYMYRLTQFDTADWEDTDVLGIAGVFRF